MILLQFLRDFIREFPNLVLERMDRMTRHLQANAMLGRQYWYVTDHWETFCTIPLYIVDKSKSGYLTGVWELGDGITKKYGRLDPAELYKRRPDADKEAARRNKYNQAGRYGNG